MFHEDIVLFIGRRQLWNSVGKLYPWSLYVEDFLSTMLATQYWIMEASGNIRYKDRVPQIYEFVDDDDDFDAIQTERRVTVECDGVAWV